MENVNHLSLNDHLHKEEYKTKESKVQCIKNISNAID